MLKRILSAAITAAVAFQCASAFKVNAAGPKNEKVDPLQYDYEVYPLLEPFNQYFYVKTDNPDPESFRFSDADTPYSETSVIEYVDSVYADVEYENEETYRVKGGYIFKSSTTNGGEISLQFRKDITKAEFNTEVYGTPTPEFTGYSPYHGIPVGTYKQYTSSNSYYILGYYRWTDSDVKIELPELCDNCDYLINKYSSGEDFFANMDSIQKGFSSDCLYSGSYIRGEVYKSATRDWRLSPAGHIDQIFYIYSPYARKGNRYLFASTLYPFKYDSLGFPGMMGSIAKRLSDEASYTWSDSNHSLIQVTYDGVTKSYGGQGRGEGQGISEDKISKYFAFDDDSEALTLSEARKLLDDYANIEMEDDIPREGMLTWKTIYDVVGDGAWVDMGGNFAYLYQANDKASFSGEEWGVGNNIYWGGSLGYASDMWVDGRYVGKGEYFTPRAVLDDHPQSAVLLTQAVVPVVVSSERKWDSEAKKYVYTSMELRMETRKNVIYRYDSDLGLWKTSAPTETSSISADTIKTLVEDGLADEEYYSALTLTREEVEAIINNGATYNSPEKGYFFDGYAPQGTPFLKGDANDDGEANIADLVTLQKWLLGSETEINLRNCDLCIDRKINGFDLSALRTALIEKAPAPFVAA